jgi:hypothetical protein
MSGTAQFPAPVLLGTLPAGPAEGSRCVSLSVNWDQQYSASKFSSFAVPLNLLSQYNTGAFTTLQSVFVDNSTCSIPVTITAPEVNQTLRIPPFSQGMYPLIVAPATVLTLSGINPPGNLYTGLTGSAWPSGTTKFCFLNTPQRYYQAAVQGKDTGPWGSLSWNLSNQLGNTTWALMPQPGLPGGFQPPTLFYAFGGMQWDINVSGATVASNYVALQLVTTFGANIAFATANIPLVITTPTAFAGSLYRNQWSFDPPLFLSDGSGNQNGFSLKNVMLVADAGVVLNGRFSVQWRGLTIQ